MLPPRLLPLRYFSPSWRVIQIRQASSTNGTPPKRHSPRRHCDNSQPSTKPSDSIISPENDAISRDISRSEVSPTNSDADFVSPSRETQIRRRELVLTFNRKFEKSHSYVKGCGQTIPVSTLGQRSHDQQRRQKRSQTQIQKQMAPETKPSHTELYKIRMSLRLQLDPRQSKSLPSH